MNEAPAFRPGVVHLRHGPGLVPADLPFVDFDGNLESRNAARRVAMDLLEISQLTESVVLKIVLVTSIILAAVKARLTDKHHLELIRGKVF